MLWSTVRRGAEQCSGPRLDEYSSAINLQYHSDQVDADRNLNEEEEADENDKHEHRGVGFLLSSVLCHPVHSNESLQSDANLVHGVYKTRIEKSEDNARYGVNHDNTRPET